MPTGLRHLSNHGRESNDNNNIDRSRTQNVPQTNGSLFESMVNVSLLLQHERQRIVVHHRKVMNDI
jgi:hypothetical protein